ncbi:hypothetical protein B0H19DRAFT_1098313 [Mycena capillaripes]|nr:hypothetical protein B0H19DRAFT_1098313 [Mycena capillaripes]
MLTWYRIPSHYSSFVVSPQPTSPDRRNALQAEAPQYIPAKIILVVTEIVTAGLALALRIYYGWQNSVRDAAEKRERETGDVREVANIEWPNCAFSDLENKTFR